MKKTGILLSFILCNIGVYATPLKKRLSNLESNVSYLARNESKTWREIAFLNNEITHLEKKIYKKLGKPTDTLPCVTNDPISDDKYYDQDLPDDND